MSTMSIPTVCLVFVVYLTKLSSSVGADIADLKVIDQVQDPNDWLITRNMWLAATHNNTEKTDEYNPLRLVVIGHTVSQECNTFLECASQMRLLQNYFLNVFNSDIPYNFIIGNDGRVYEGRGWNKVGAHTFGYNRCTLGLAFVGDYREGSPHFSRVTVLQQLRAYLLFQEGIKLGYLHPNFHVLGAKDLHLTLSPGSNLYNVIRNWPNYDHQNRYKDLTCEQIKEL